MNQSKTLIVENKNHDKTNINEIRLTGNWFIDAGILGFVNLMEEVYGWDLEELNFKVNKNPENVYYGYFPFAYLFFNSKIRTNFKEVGVIKKRIKSLIEKKKVKQHELKTFLKSKKNSDLDKLPKKDLNKVRRLEKKILEFENQVKDLNLEINEHNDKLNIEKEVFSNQIEINIDKILLNSNKMFMDVRDEIENLILDFDLNLPQDHRNFFLYNPKKDVFLSFTYLYYLLRMDYNIIKLIRALKDRKSFIEFNSFCEDIKIDHLVLIETIEKMLNEQKRKPKIIEFCEKEFCLDNTHKETLKKKWYPKIQKEFGKEDFLYEVSPDSTINPFLYSPTEFANVGYTIPLTLNEISSGLKLEFPVYILLLSFGRSFQFFARRNILFYTNNLKISYLINKRIKTKISRMGKNDSLFRITWSSIIDELIENKAKFSLENMYLIEFEGIENQKLKDVKYLGISKLVANIIIDDTIRDALNTNIQINSGNSEWIWLLEELIINKSLFPYTLKHINLRINKNTNQKLIKALLYSLSVDAKIKSILTGERRVFGQYSLEVGDLVFHINESYKWMDMSSKTTSKIISHENKEKIIHSLFSAIKKQNKYYFVNIILKALFEENEKDLKLVRYLNNYIFKHIVQNEKNWENYALAMLVGFL